MCFHPDLCFIALLSQGKRCPSPCMRLVQGFDPLPSSCSRTWPSQSCFLCPFSLLLPFTFTFASGSKHMNSSLTKKKKKTECSTDPYFSVPSAVFNLLFFKVEFLKGVARCLQFLPPIYFWTFFNLALALPPKTLPNLQGLPDSMDPYFPLFIFALCCCCLKSCCLLEVLFFISFYVSTSSQSLSMDFLGIISGSLKWWSFVPTYSQQ